jgi:hypothetical protein
VSQVRILLGSPLFNMIKVYLAGEIHTNWREELIDLCKSANLDIQFSSPVTNHENSDNCGVEILGTEEKNFWKDQKGANINSIRTQKSIKDSDIVLLNLVRNTNNGMLPLMLVMQRHLKNQSLSFIVMTINMRLKKSMQLLLQ